MTTVAVGEKYQVVIPKEIREKIGLRKHCRLQVALENNQIIMRVPEVSYMRGIGSDLADGKDATAYVRELREEWQTRKRK